MKLILQLLVTFISLTLTAQQKIEAKNITIVRDSFGVPHIFAKTDAEVSYGLAWAHAEDDFKSLQDVVLPAKGLMGRVMGKAGAAGDYAFALFRCREITKEKWNTLSPAFINVMEAYVQGINDYAMTHKSEWLHPQLFPVTSEDYIASSVLALTVFNGADEMLLRIYANKIWLAPDINNTNKGSNAMSVHPSKTTTGEAFLLVNAHQPNMGSQAFYEAHINSEEGLNVHGGLLAGGLCILHGVNEHLGWAHTVNYCDRVDVFQLEMNPENNNQYKFDGQWIDLEQKKIKLRIKGIPVAVGRTVYWSKYGATMKNKQGVFSIRLGANMDIRTMEQWYEMDKAKNYTEFYNAIKDQRLSMFNIMYADKYDTVFYVNNALMPVRDAAPQYDWRKTLPGNTSKTLWTTFRKFNQLPQYLNPKSGIIFNTNHTSFAASGRNDNLNPNLFPKVDGWENYHNNRSIRMYELLDNNKLSYEQFKAIKFDKQLPNQLAYPYNIDTMLLMKADEYPQLNTIITNFQQWDRKGDSSSKGAAVFLLTYEHVKKIMEGHDARRLTKAECVATYQAVYDYMMKYFGKDDIVLGDVQKLVRGDKDYPLWGFPDLLSPQWTERYKDGKLKSVGGDGLIMFIRFPKDGLPIIETVNMYGASARPGNKHFDDQVEMYRFQKTKRMTLNKEEVYKNAERIYHPGE
ncbi:penicillin acylase family protein [Planktothrix agardhii 1031]|uniref:penicillin acylase family protein n=1 Tax=Planktothrix agardhii TaxID=1160 RepID=UPI001D099FB0|nr:penicillin acylase family protein [Planktothrix agardhii]MCB8777870.1 penicillin acylase family protein [Planktothrix agardhii 1031]